MNESGEHGGDDYRYWAFLSYSHHDRRFAQRLLNTLETYPVRRVLHDAPGAPAALPARLTVCRDVDEFAASPDLSEQIREKLRQSRFLIVVCSRSSAKTTRRIGDDSGGLTSWVNEEIRYFQSLGRASHILTIIKEGVPYASVETQTPAVAPEDECYPPALRWKIDLAGRPTQEKSEMLSADARPHGEGLGKATLRLIARIVDVPFAILEPREKRRQRRARQQIAAVASAVVAVILGLSLWAGWSRVQARLADARSRAVPHVRQSAVQRAERSYVSAALSSVRARMESADLQPAEIVATDLARALAVTAYSPRSSITGRAAWSGALLAISDSAGRLQAWRPRAGDARWEAVWLSRGTHGDVMPGTESLPLAAISDVTWASGQHDGVFVSTGEDGAIRGWRGADGSAAWVRQDEDAAHVRHRFVSASARPGSRDSQPDLAAGDADGGVWLLSHDGGTKARRWQPHGGLVRTVRWRPDGQEFCTASFDGTVQVWKHDGSSIRKLDLPGVSGRVLVADYSPDGRWLAAGGDAGLVGVWNAANGEPHGKIKLLLPVWNDHGGVKAVAWLDGSHLLAAGADGGVQVWDVGRTALDRTLVNGQPGAGWIADVGWAGPVGNGKVAISGPAGLRIVDAETGRPLQSMEGPKSELNGTQVVGADVSPDGKYVALSSLDRATWVRLFDLESLQIVASFPAPRERTEADVRRFLAPTPLALSPGGAKIAWGEPGGLIRISDARDGSVTAVIADAHPTRAMPPGSPEAQLAEASQTGILAMAWNSDGKLLVSRGVDMMVRVWDAERGFQKVHEFRDQRSEALATRKLPTRPTVDVADCKFVPGTDLIVTALQDHKLRVWNARHGTEPVSVLDQLPAQARVTGVTLSSDGHFLAAGTDGGMVGIWNTRQRFELVQVINIPSRVDALPYDDSTEPVAMRALDREASNGPWSDRGVRGVAFSPGTTTVAVTTNDGRMGVYHAATGHLMASTFVLERRHQQAGAIPLFSHSGRLVTLDMDGAMRLWDRAWPSRQTGRLPLRWTVRSLSGAPDGSGWLAQTGPGSYARAWTSDGTPMQGLNVSVTGPVSASTWLDGGARIALAVAGGVILVMRRDGTSWLEEKRVTPPAEAERQFVASKNVPGFAIETAGMLPELRVTSLAPDDAGTYLAAAWIGKTVWVLDLASWQWRPQPLAENAEPTTKKRVLWTQLVARPGHRELVATDGYGRTACWSTDDGRVRWEIDGWTSSLNETPLAFTPDGRLLAMGGGTGEVKIVNGDSGAQVALTPMHGSDENGMRRVPSVRWLKRGTLLATVAADRLLYLWDVSSSSQGGKIRLAGLAPVYSWRAIAVNAPDEGTEKDWTETLELFRDEPEPGRVLLSLHAVAPSQDERTLAVAHGDGVALFGVDGLLEDMKKLTAPETHLLSWVEDRTGMRLEGTQAVPRFANALVPARAAAAGLGQR